MPVAVPPATINSQNRTKGRVSSKYLMIREMTPKAKKYTPKITGEISSMRISSAMPVSPSTGEATIGDSHLMAAVLSAFSTICPPVRYILRICAHSFALMPNRKGRAEKRWFCFLAKLRWPPNVW